MRRLRIRLVLSLILIVSILTPSAFVPAVSAAKRGFGIKVKINASESVNAPVVEKLSKAKAGAFLSVESNIAGAGG